MDNPLNRSPLISVIIPTLNEADRIGATLEGLVGTNGLEVIVVDGGSSDDTRARAAAAGARVIEAAGGRAAQMNGGARIAKGDILLFLHADTRLPFGFADPVRKTLDRPDAAAGAFRLSIDAKGFGFRWLERLVGWRSRRLAMPYGDQGLFMKATKFNEVGGFPEQPIMEDFELVRRLRRRGKIFLLPLTITTSARRWQTLGLARTTLINQAIILGYLFGVKPARLARWYRTRKGYRSLQGRSLKTG